MNRFRFIYMQKKISLFYVWEQRRERKGNVKGGLQSLESLAYFI